jgi:hypothetical protein
MLLKKMKVFIRNIKIIKMITPTNYDSIRRTRTKSKNKIYSNI